MVPLGATVLVRGKWQVLAMLVPSARSGRDCAWLRSRRAQARGAFAPPCAPRPLEDVGTRSVPTCRRALAARRRARSSCIRWALTEPGISY